MLEYVLNEQLSSQYRALQHTSSSSWGAKPFAVWRHLRIMQLVMKELPIPSDGITQADVERLCEQAKLGDESAFEGLYRATVGKIYGLCLRMTADPGLAEDCTQNAYVRAWQKLAEFRGDSGITTWLHRIAVNEVLSAHRREKRHQHEEADLQKLIGANFSVDVDLERAIVALPERARQVFVLFGIYGYGHKETADLLEIAEGTSKAHYHQARRLLQGTLGERDESRE